MKRIELIIVTIVAICLGTSMHFAHHLPFFNHFMGYVFPVNECVWEHMKMLFYPMLLTSIYMCLRERSMAPFGGMAISLLCCIPVQIAAFFGYWLFTREVIEIVDIVAYLVVMCGGFWWGNKLAAEDRIRKNWGIAIGIDVCMIILIGILTYHNPDWLLFDPGL